MNIIFKITIFSGVLFFFAVACVYAQADADAVAVGAPSAGVFSDRGGFDDDVYVVADDITDYVGMENRMYSDDKIICVERITPVQEVPVVMRSKKYKLKGSFVAGL